VCISIFKIKLKNTKVPLRIKVIILVICFYLFDGLNTYVLAQCKQFKFQSITSEDGLSSNWVNDVVRDKVGFIWIATKSGLDRYDGSRVVSYRTIEGDSTSIPSNYINSLLVDNDNNIWIGTVNKGLCIYNRKNDTFKSFDESGTYGKLVPINIRSLIQHSNGEIWVGTAQRGVLIYNSSTDKFRQAYQFSYQEHVSGMVEDANGHVYVANESDTLLICDPDEEFIGKIALNGLPDDKYGVKTEKILYFDSDSLLWIGTNGLGAYTYDINSRVLSNFIGLSNPIIKDILQRENEILLATDNGGLNIFNRETKSIRIFRNNPYDKYSLTSNGLYNLMIDEEGILWVATFDGGLNYYNPKNHQFQYFYPIPNISGCITHHNVISMAQGKGNEIYIGTDGGGLNIFNEETQTFKRIDSPKNSKVLNDNHIVGVLYESDTLFVSAFQLGVELIDLKGGVVKSILSDELIGNKNIKSFIKDNEGYLWMKTNNGFVYKYNLQTGKNIVINPDFKWDGTDEQFIASLIHKDCKNNIWIGSIQGSLKYYNTSTNTFVAYKLHYDNAENQNVVINSLVEDCDGNIWLGTAKGLFRVEIQDNNELHLKRLFHANLNLVFDMILDKSGVIWISSDDGLYSVKSNSKELRKYNSRDGLQGKEFSETSSLLSENGILYFGGVKGLNSFKPNEIKVDTFCSSLIFTDLKILNQSTSTKQKDYLDSYVTTAKQLTITHEDYVFSLEFLLINYTNPDKVKYKYKLDGFDKNWITTDNRGRMVTYTNIPGGDYVFRVKAYNHDGKLCDKELTLAIKVIPPFYKENWFIGLSVLFVMLGIYFFNKYRTRFLEKQNAKLENEVRNRTEKIDNQKNELELKNAELEVHRNHLEELVDERTKDLVLAKEKAEESDRLKSAFLANMSHEIRTPMNAIVGFSTLLNNVELLPEEKQNFLNIIGESSETLLRLIDDIIDISKIEAGQMVVKNEDVELNSFLNSIYAEYEERIGQIKGQKVKVELDIPKSVIVARIDRTRIRQVLVNLMDNASKFTVQGSIKLSLHINKSELEFSVTDTGIGINQDNLEIIFQRFTKIEQSSETLYGGTGLGLFISKRIVELYRGTIGVDSEIGKGSRFWFTLPI